VYDAQMTGDKQVVNVENHNSNDDNNNKEMSLCDGGKGLIALRPESQLLC